MKEILCCKDLDTLDIGTANHKMWDFPRENRASNILNLVSEEITQWVYYHSE